MLVYSTIHRKVILNYIDNKLNVLKYKNKTKNMPNELKKEYDVLEDNILK